MGRTRVVQLDAAPQPPVESTGAEWSKVTPCKDGTIFRWRADGKLYVRSETHSYQEDAETDTITSTRTVQTSSRPAHVRYEDLLATVKVQYDADYGRMPWEDFDEYEHHIQSTDEFAGQLTQYRRTAGYIGGSTHLGAPQRLVLDYGGEATRRWHRAHGASKQVAFQRAALDRARTLAQLVSWHARGWDWYGVEMDFCSYTESLWGFSSYTDAWTAGRTDLIPIIVRQLEDDGYIVTGQPTPPKLLGRRWTREGFQEHLRDQLNSQNMEKSCGRSKRS